jgi:hypothetical protein
VDSVDNKSLVNALLLEGYHKTEGRLLRTSEMVRVRFHRRLAFKGLYCSIVLLQPLEWTELLKAWWVPLSNNVKMVSNEV